MTSAGSPASGGGRASTLLVIAAAVCFGTTGTAQALGASDASALSLGAARIVFGGALLAVIALCVVLRSRAHGGAATQGARDALRHTLVAPADAPVAPVAPQNAPTAPQNAAAQDAIDAHASDSTPRLRARGRRMRWSSLALVVVGAVGVAAYQPTFFTGTRENGVAIGTLVALGSAPVLTGLLEWGVRRTAPGLRWALATLVAAAGVAVLSGAFDVLTGGTPGAASVTPLGLLGSLGAGASYAVYALSSKLLLDRGWAPTAAMGATFGAAALIMTPVLIASDLDWLMQPGGILGTAWLAVVTVALAYTLFARGLRNLPASRVATLTLVEPLTATVLGVLLLHEMFTASSAGGLLLLIAGIVILSIGRRPSVVAL